jgi:hypothetical protein
MAALLLSFAGAGLGGSLFGSIGAIAGRIVGAVAGSVIDRALLSGGPRQVTGPRLADLDVMSSTEGAPIPRVYGRARLSGQVIWATQLEEVVSTDTSSSGGKSIGAPQTATTTYSYFANFAVALCEGVVGHVGRIWVDGKLLDLAGVTWRFYPGTETQDPDALIVAKEGADNAPGYRGIAYVVFERLALANFGNRVPQLSFEIIRPIGELERMVRAVTLIPGTTEFGYEPSEVTQVLGPGAAGPENRHLAHAPSDVDASLDELQGLCPNLERVAIVVTWFGSDLRAGHCTVKPGVEIVGKTTSPLTWGVAGVDRSTAYLVSQIDGRPAFGGTPSDNSVADLIAALKARGLKVTLYPFLMMDIAAGNTLADPWTGAAAQPAYPWRGHITCDPAPGEAGSPDGTAAAATQVAALFGTAAPGDFTAAGGSVAYTGPDEWTLRRMILHYATLAAAAGGVDAFLIGSELKSLTRVRSGSGVYPAVTQLVSLAADVKGIVGAGAAVTYGADWTEYGAHVVDPDASEVRFPLDPLWASPAIGAVGIDYYAPLADWRGSATELDRALTASIYERGYLARNLAAGEAYDFFYADDAARIAQARSPITDGGAGKPWVFRQKDLWNWWANPHYERVGGAELATPTAWVAQGKPIWLTEIGCPAVDKGANQPSIFPDPKSADGGVPYFSDGSRDDLMQRRYLEAALATFDPAFGASDAGNPVSTVYGDRMIDAGAIHLWTWDARPYPVFPAALDVWSDGGNWETGHWLTGRLGSTPMAPLIAAILADSGIGNVDATSLLDGPEGYVIDRPMTPRDAIEPLTLAYAFGATEDGETLHFVPRGGDPVMTLGEDDLVLADEASAPAQLTRTQESELPREVSIAFTDSGSDYRRSAVASRRLVGQSSATAQADLAVITDDAAMRRRADIWLQDVWVAREAAEFALPPSRLALTCGDVIAATIGGRQRLLELRQVVDTESRSVTAQAIDSNVFGMPLGTARRRVPKPPTVIAPAYAELMALPTLPGDAGAILLRAAIFASPWPGPIAVWESADGASFDRAATAVVPAVAGVTLDPLPAGPVSRWDRVNAFRVRVYGGALASASDLQVLGGANAAAVQRGDGGWEVLQFANATLTGDRTYQLSRLLRGQVGSEWAMGDPLPAGAPFVVLNEALVAVVRWLDALGRPLQLRIVAASRDYSDPSTVALAATPGATALTPLAPVHVGAIRAGDGIHIAWVRRTRIDGDAWEPADVPLGEDSEAYEVDVLSGTSVVRTLSAGTPAVLYPAASEIADFGAPQASLSLRVYQLSTTVGRGYPASTVVHALA